MLLGENYSLNVFTCLFIHKEAAVYQTSINAFKGNEDQTTLLNSLRGKTSVLFYLVKNRKLLSL